MDGGVNVDTTTMEDATNNKNTGIDNSMIAYVKQTPCCVIFTFLITRNDGEVVKRT